GGTLLPIGRLTQFLHLIALEPARLAGFESADANWPNGDALQPQYLVAQLRQQTANLTVLSLGQDDAQPGRVAALLQTLDPARVDMAIAQPDALEQLLLIGAARAAKDQDVIGFLDAEARVHKPMGQLAVVGH